MSSSTQPSTGSVGCDRAEDRTVIGADLGEKTLVAALPAGAALDEAFVVDGGRIQGQYHAIAEGLNATRDTGFATDTGETQLVAGMWSEMREQIRDAATRTVAYASQFSDPLLAVEDLRHDPIPLWEHELAGDCGTWLLPVVQDAIVSQATEAGIDVVSVDPRYSSKLCHRCGDHGDLGRSTLLCTTDGCPVGRVDRDRSAAATLASRVQDDAARGSLAGGGP